MDKEKGTKLYWHELVLSRKAHLRILVQCHCNKLVYSISVSISVILYWMAKASGRVIY